MVALKITDHMDCRDFDAIIEAIEYSQEKGIYILNISINVDPSQENDSPGYISRLETAIRNYDGLVVCSAGNAAQNLDEFPSYPASFNLPNLITVGASDINNKIWYDDSYDEISGSNYSETAVDIFAPGDDIYSCESGFPFGYTDRYCSYDGTSQAATYVAGVAALLLSEYPDMDADDIKMTIIENAVKPRGNDPDDSDTYDQYLLEGLCVTDGLLNAKMALQNPIYHTHQYSATSVHHRMECVCGDFYITPHNYIVPFNNGNWFEHMLICMCGEDYIMAAHQYTVPKNYGNLTYHKMLCACGRDGGVTQAHTWVLEYSPDSSGDASVNYVPEYICTKCKAKTLVPGYVS